MTINPASAPATGTDTVTVFCKHSPGLIIRVGAMQKREEASVLGAHEVNMWQQIGSFTVAGPAKPFGGEARAPVICGYAITHGVPKELWEKWLADNKDSDMVRNRVIYAADRESYGSDEAKELKDVKTGMEPLRRAKDPRTAALNNSTSTMTGVETLVRND